METVKVQLIERDREEITEAMCIHSRSLKAPSLSNGWLRIQTQLIPHNIPGTSRNRLRGGVAHSHSLLEAETVRLSSQQLEFVVRGRGVMQAAEQTACLNAGRLCRGAHEGILLCFLQKDGGGSVISSDIKATRKLLESSFYKSPFEKHLPSP